MKKWLVSGLVAIGLLVSGCNGSSDANESSSGGSGVDVTPTAISLTVTNSNGQSQSSFAVADTITFTATVRDQNNNILSGQKVDFTATLGQLSPGSKLTDSQGQAIVSLANSEAAIGAATITATIGELSTVKVYEFTSSGVNQALPKLSTLLSLNGIAVNQFKANQQANVSATLVDANNQAIANAIVKFSAEIGTLTAPSALTNSQGVATVGLTGGDSLGAGVLTANYEQANVNQNTNYQILAEDAVVVDPGLRIGHFDNNNSFVEGKVKLSIASNTLSAGGTLGLTVDLIDGQGNRVAASTPVSFSSNCVVKGDASIDAVVNTINGRAQATYQDIKCAGSTGIDDLITASITSGGTEKLATETVQITGEQLGAIEFVSALPSEIVLKGTGGQGKQETSTLTFQIKSALGNPLAQQAVNFSLSTSAGGIELNPSSGLTNSQGMITTKVTSGTVPTAVRVSAVTSLNNASIQTQSDLLSINTGLPEQRSFTIAASLLNPEANSVNGVTSQITAYLADNFNNPVPDGTTVNFTTEGGVIEPSCNTVNGACSVTWTSSEPRVADHRITILATALGHESFFDTNGNNSFDDNDGDTIDATNAGNTSTFVASGFGRATSQASGFLDMSEAWRDDNTNGIRDAGEVFIDFDNDKSFDGRDSLFNGPQCTGNKCASENARLTHVRKAMELVMASSDANFSLSANGTLIATQAGNVNAIPDIPDGESLNFTLAFSDTAGQVMPNGTTVNITASNGDIEGHLDITVGNTNVSGNTGLSFTILNPVGGDPEIGALKVTITSPSGVISGTTEVYNLN